MNDAIRVVLAVRPRVVRDVLRQMLLQQPAVQIVDEAEEPVDLLVAVRSTEPHVVVHTLDANNEMPSVCTHLLLEFPGLIVVGVSPTSGQVYVYRQEITTTPLCTSSPEEVLSAIRSQLVA